MVDVIIPVYKGLEETKRCLESIFASGNQTSFELIVINDCSPDRELTEFLRFLHGEKRISLLENPKNLGFVKTVNRGMTLHLNRDVLLLNSDTEVADDWLDRIRACAYRGKNIGTVTPFSNNATICSYPLFCKTNELPNGYSLAEIDHLFKTFNSGRYLPIPTAVGFCMFIRRDCLNQVGLFDEESFGLGYGEENDFCFRAQRKGWQDVLCADTFVQHVGGASFGASQLKRKNEAAETLRRLHPHFDALIQQFIEKDGVRPFRQPVDLYRINKNDKKKILLVTHNLGGGTERHVHDLISFVGGRAEVFTLTPYADTPFTRLFWRNPKESLQIYFSLGTEYDEFIETLKYIGISRIHFHHIIGLDPLVFNIAKDLGVDYDFTVHDFYSMCPRIHFISKDQTYCGEPDEKGCSRCLATKPYSAAQDIRAWREKYRLLLESAQRVLAPSDYVTSRIKSHFPFARILTADHVDAETSDLSGEPAAQRLEESEPLKIGILGKIDKKKGMEILLQCSQDAKERNLPLRFQLIGSLLPEPRARNQNEFLTIHGSYEDSDLDEILRSIHPHLLWFPAQCPETYSYTLSAALKNGLPVVSSDLGALPERLAGRKWSWIFPWRLPARGWNEEFMKIRNNFIFQSPPPIAPLIPSKRSFSYSGQYLDFLELDQPNFGSPTVQPDIRVYSFPARKLRKNPSKHARLIVGILLFKLKRTGALDFMAKTTPHRTRQRLKQWLFRL